MNRLWIVLLFAGLMLHPSLFAQQTGTGATTGAGSSFGAGAAGGTSAFPGSGAAGGGTSTLFPTQPTSGAAGTISPFPSGVGSTPPSGSSALSAGVPSGTTPTAAAPPTLTVPGGYGFQAQTITPGEGRFAQPPIRFTFSVSQGYDDNVFSTPTHPAKPQSQVVLTQRIKRTSAPQVIIGGPFGTRVVQVPKLEVVTEPVVVTPTDTQQPKTGSAVTNASVGVQIQSANARTALTLDLTAGGLYYWNRPGGDSLDRNASVGLTYLHRISPRMTFSTAVDVVYQAQPDFSRINAPTRQTPSGGNYLSGNLKADLFYLWSPRVSTITSYALNTTLLGNSGTDESNLYQQTLGTQLRYMFSPRTTVATEYRQSASTYPNAAERDSTSAFFLVGADVNFSRRLRATTRFGEEIRSYQSGPTQGSPYVETSTAFVFTRNSTLNWTNRFGFEESPSATERRVSYRTSFSLNEALSTRLTANLGVAYNRSTSSALVGDDSEEVIEQQIQTNLGVSYVLTRKISLNANYSFSQILSTLPNTDYRRNQVFLGGTYSF